MNLLIDLTPRLRVAFGFVPLVATPEPLPYSPVRLGGTAAKVYSRGNPAFEDIHLAGNGLYLDFEGKSLSKSGELGSIFAPPPMVAYRKVKNHIITQIDGTDTEVVERYGDGAWELTMQGLLVDMANHHFPYDRIEKLRKAFEVPDTWEISGDMMAALGIHDVFFTEVTITPVQGFEDTCSFTLDCRSIKPSQFYLTSPDGK